MILKLPIKYVEFPHENASNFISIQWALNISNSFKYRQIFYTTESYKRNVYKLGIIFVEEHSSFKNLCHHRVYSCHLMQRFQYSNSKYRFSITLARNVQRFNCICLKKRNKILQIHVLLKHVLLQYNFVDMQFVYDYCGTAIAYRNLWRLRQDQDVKAAVSLLETEQGPDRERE